MSFRTRMLRGTGAAAASLTLSSLPVLLATACLGPGTATDDGGDDGTGRPAGTYAARAAAERLEHPYPDIDLRGTSRTPPTAAQRRAARNLPGTAVRWGRTGTPQVIVPGEPGGPADADPDAPERIALAYVREHAGLYRLSAADVATLKVAASYRNRLNGVRHVFIDQYDGDRPVFGSRLSVAVDRGGRIVLAGGTLAPGAHAASHGRLAPQAAIGRAARSVGSRPPAGALAEPVVFACPDGARAAFRSDFTADNGHLYETVVDAVDGTLLYRHDLTSAEGPGGPPGPRGRVFTGQHPDTGPATLVPFGGLGRSWVEGRVTTGNNAEVSQDLHGQASRGYQPRTARAGHPTHQDFDYVFTDAFRKSRGRDLRTDRDAAVSQAFYYVNRVHDHLYALGFDEASGNFQEDNLGRGGIGGDRVRVYVDYGADDPDTACNSDFSTPPDGRSPTMRLFVGRRFCGNDDIERAMNGDTIAHEYAHGLSGRLVGGGRLGAGPQTDALSEGWSDAIATSMWGDPVYGEYNNGVAATGIRRVAYDHSGLTYGDLCRGGCEEHDDGEIWATVMWDLRTALIRVHGTADGRYRHERLMVDGMKFTPPTPDFLDARDGILAAERADGGGTDQCLLWGVFARRGLGAGARSPSQRHADPAADVPAGCRPVARPGGPYRTAEGTPVTLDASGSTLPGGGTYAWDFDGDGAYDDATGVSPLYDRVGRDGVRTVGLKVISADGTGVSTGTTTVTVGNVPPVVRFDVLGPDRAGRLTVSGTITDPGRLDALTATADVGDGRPVPLPGRLEHGPTGSILTFTGTLALHGGGVLTVTVCGSDEHATTCARRQVASAVPSATPTTAPAVPSATPAAAGPGPAGLPPASRSSRP